MIAGLIIACAIFGVLLGFALVLRSNGSHIRGFPFALSPTYTITYSNFFLDLYVGSRQKLSEEPTMPSHARHIVIIVDESVRGDYINIDKIRPSQSSSFFDSHNIIYDYGESTSFTNSSSSSNLAIITGLTLSDLPDFEQKSRKAATIFDYAENAGHRSFHIYGQGDYKSQPTLSSHVTRLNIQELVPSVPHWLIDRIILKELSKILESEHKTFTYINKQGCHFDYDSNYPPDRTTHTPTYSTEPNRLGLENSYRNCIEWAVEDFFVELRRTLDAENTVVIYTSDHGQSLLDDGRPGTHNRTQNALAVEANVPLLVWLPQALSKHPGLPFIKENIGKTAAANIFPTTLQLFGYEVPDKHDTSSIFEPLRDHKRHFLAGSLWGKGNYKIYNIDSP